MWSSDPERSSAAPPRCAACGDVIGVYEPLVHLFSGLAWRTSRAAEPSICAAGGEHYHLDCYDGQAGEPQG